MDFRHAHFMHRIGVAPAIGDGGRPARLPAIRIIGRQLRLAEHLRLELHGAATERCRLLDGRHHRVERAFLDLPLEILLDRAPALRERALGDVDHRHGEPRLGADVRDAVPHLSGADHRDHFTHKKSSWRCKRLGGVRRHARTPQQQKNSDEHAHGGADPALRPPTPPGQPGRPMIGQLIPRRRKVQPAHWSVKNRDLRQVPRQMRGGRGIETPQLQPYHRQENPCQCYAGNAPGARVGVSDMHDPEDHGRRGHRPLLPGPIANGGKEVAADQEFLGLSRYPNVYLKLTPLNVSPKEWGKATPQPFFSALMS